tara:strand:+ start:1328 stop:1795 length:468 start_codon:yes stop_codon:yes gene_type:complete
MAGRKKVETSAAEAINSSASDAEAKAMLKLNEWFEQYDAADRMSVGQWYGMPDDYANGWVFTRCGVRGAPRAEALAAQMKRMGYQNAPRGTKKAGFEAADGDHGLYLCVPRQAYLMIQKRKRMAQQRMTQSVEQSFLGEMSSIPGASARAETTKL